VLRFYQEKWFGLDFSSFAELSFFRPADARFYERFYEALFRAYPSWDALPRDWREAKAVHAAWLAEQACPAARGTETGAGSVAPVRALSVGCGIGYMEYLFLKELPDAELHISEPGTRAPEWIRAHIPPERVHIGEGLGALPPDLRFDLIYFSATDYFLDQGALTALLAEARVRLAPGGRMFLLSASLLEEEGVSILVNRCKIVLRALLHLSGIRRQQFWGRLRTREEYRAAVSAAGFTEIEEGRLHDGARTFWISGFAGKAGRSGA
jgi:SAM-dependent methyltransferase